MLRVASTLRLLSKVSASPISLTNSEVAVGKKGAKTLGEKSMVYGRRLNDMSEY